MARQGDVFPRRDLPGTSENWGRHVEDRIVLGERSEIQLSQKVDNGLLANEGQLATISNQLNDIYDQQVILAGTVTELSNRSTHSDAPSNLQIIHGGTTGSSGPNDRTVSLPAPAGSQRSAMILGSGSVAWTGTATGPLDVGDLVYVGIEFRQDTVRKWYVNTTASSTQRFAWEGSNTFSMVIPVVVPLAGSAFDLRMWVGRTSSGGQANAGARLEGMQFTIIYGDPTL